MRSLLGVFVATIAILIALTTLRTHPVWTPDGAIYARMMLVARGVPADRASREARAFFVATDLGKRATYRSALTRDPTRSFSTVGPFLKDRVLYPYVSAALYGAFGFGALIVVSAMAYAVAGVLVYAILVRFVALPFATSGALLFLAAPPVRTLGASSLTDMLAIAIWFGVLLALIALVSETRISGAAIVVFTLGCAALLVTRPFVYVPLAAVSVFAFERFALGDRTAGRRALALAVVPFAGLVAYEAVGIAHGTPSLADNLRWMHARDIELGAPLPHDMSAWYVTRLMKTLGRLTLDAGTAIFPIVAVMWFAARPSRERTLFLGAALGAAISLFADPNSGDLVRTVEVPLAPIILAGSMLALQSFVRRTSQPRHGVSCA